MKQEIILKPIDELIPYVNNPKQHPAEQVDKIASSIKNYGFTVPMVIDGQNEIIMGHGRLQAAKKLGMEEVPCIVRDDLTESQVKALRIADNKVAESEWDIEILLAEIDGLEDFTGFSLDEIDELKMDITEPNEIIEDEAPEPPEEPKTKLGDLYILGRHRLLCGDSTKAEDVERLMGEKKANMCFTDPPYLMGFTGNVCADGSKSFNAKHGEIINDKMTREDGDAFICSIFNMIKSYVVGAWYVCFYRLGLGYLYRAIDAVGMEHRALIIWDKGNHTLSNSDYMSKYEPIMYGWVDEHKFYGSKSSFDIWHIARTAKNELHPTMKPVELCATGIKNSSEQNGIILDLFGGSGSTLIAAEQLNRICYMMELDPKYCDVIVERWENFTGQKAELVGE